MSEKSRGRWIDYATGSIGVCGLIFIGLGVLALGSEQSLAVVFLITGTVEALGGLYLFLYWRRHALPRVRELDRRRSSARGRSGS